MKHGGSGRQLRHDKPAARPRRPPELARGRSIEGKSVEAFSRLVNQPPDDRAVVELSEYRGEETLTINCTQLGDSFTPHLSSPKEKKRVLSEWCDYLKDHPESFTELTFGTRVPQELFDAVCHQRRLVELRIKWGAYEDLSAIVGLSQLRLLHLGSGARVKSIAPLTKFERLLALSVENFQKVSDYSPLSKLRRLQSLAISGDGLGPQYIKVDSLEFLRELISLRSFSLLTERLSSKDYRPVLARSETSNTSRSARPRAR